jgi:hypothetical protein
MRRQVAFISIAILLLSISAAASSQDYAVVLGEHTGDIPSAVFRYEIIDSESNAPIKGAIITITGERGKRFATLETDRWGVGIVVVLEDGKWPVWEQTLKVVADGYDYYEMKSIPREDLESGNRGLYLDGMERPQSYGDKAGWRREATDPDIDDIITAVKEGRYDIGNSSYERVGVPACFEYRIVMHRNDHSHR